MTADRTNADATVSDAVSHPDDRAPSEWTLILIRHGETEWNATGRIQGQRDVPLSEIGRRQASRISHRLAAALGDCSTRPLIPYFRTRPLRVNALFTSDLSRAAETARIVRDEAPCLTALPLITSPLLRERHFGSLQGTTTEERHSISISLLADSPGGETEQQVYDRMSIALDEIAASTRQLTSAGVLLFGHGGSLRALICRVLGLPAEAMRSFRLDNTSVSVLSVAGTLADGRLQIQTGRVITLNDTAHLLEAAIPTK